MTTTTPVSPLVAVATKTDLAHLLGTTVELLNLYTYGLPSARRYRTTKLRKRSGGEREICAPIGPLKAMQRKLVDLLTPFYRPRWCVFGYVPGRDVVKKASKHLTQRWVLRVDLEDFFPRLHHGRIVGLLKSPPFGLPLQIAKVVATICTHEGKLPQGAPTSPLLSNLLTRGLDKELARLSRQTGCRYTRYCDDLVFSTRRNQFPKALASIESIPGEATRVLVGEGIETAVGRAGLKVNLGKLSLKQPQHRQIVAGIVVNSRLNIPREYVRGLRAVLHAWKKFGLFRTRTWFFANHYNRNRHGKKRIRFREVIRGRVTHVGRIRGWADPLYLRLVADLCALDRQFVPKYERPKAGKVTVFTEGKTDVKHMSLALSHLRSQGKFVSLDVDFQIPKSGEGSRELINTCKGMSSATHGWPQVFAFDSDEKDVIKTVTNSTGDTKDWGSNVFSLVLPSPPHRAADAPLCIEMLYPDSVLQTPNGQQLRIFLRSEFEQSGFHKTGQYVSTRKGGSLVVDDDVYDLARRKVALSKDGFCKHVESLGALVDFSGFEPFFERLEEVGNKLAGKSLLVLNTLAAHTAAALSRRTKARVRTTTPTP
jgi:RNA-directed DNA polymerase